VLVAAIGVAVLAALSHRGAGVAHGAPDADYSLTPIGPRVRQFLWDSRGAGQGDSRAPARRPRARIRVLGFCAFALVTLNHFAEAFGVRLLSPASAWGPRLSDFVAVWAVAVAVAITGLFMRRFVARHGLARQGLEGIGRDSRG